jgi:hypothetical protein
MAIGWMIKVDVTGDGYKDSVRGYAVAIRNRDEAMAAAREASGERVVEVDGEMTRKIFDELHLKPGEVNFHGQRRTGSDTLNAVLTNPAGIRNGAIRRRK